jgi:hypothetical protein
MNTEALFLFLILLLGLVLCSFLGGNCNNEGFTLDIPPINIDLNNNQSNKNNNQSQQNNNKKYKHYWNNHYNYDNYNHYSGSSTTYANGQIYYGPNGSTAIVVTNSNGTESIKLTSPTGVVMFNSTPLNVSSTSATPQTNTSSTSKIFYGPFGLTAIFITGSNNELEILFNKPDGEGVVFTQTNPSTISNFTTQSSQYYGSTGSPIQLDSYSLAYSNQYYGPNGGTAGSFTGPNGNTAYYAQGPNGNTNSNSTSSGYGTTYSSTLPPGIPASQIPPGQEDLYILKSEIVPPVCPACPSCESSFSSNNKQSKCPPCPACARCPEPSFECKKVPNYNSISENYLPQPVVSDFSQFGM